MGTGFFTTGGLGTGCCTASGAGAGVVVVVVVVVVGSTPAGLPGTVVFAATTGEVAAGRAGAFPDPEPGSNPIMLAIQNRHASNTVPAVAR